ncbi:MAG: hypothetical protein NC043_02990 [Muribaculaceae bacterium]|nr:hypothetical protein [Muribaculaceae bacterium]
MKRTFLNVALFSLLAVSMPVSFVSCKDYDDDITSINNTNDGLSKQITQLQQQLEACQTVANNAASNAAAAMKKGDDAMAQAELAKQAAAQAKADAIAAVIEQLQPLINTNAEEIQKNADAIAALLSRVEAIEKGGAATGLDAIQKQVNDNEKAIQAISLQMDALAKFKSALNGANFEGISGLISNIDALNAAYAELKKDAATQSDITAINTRIDNLAQQVITEVNSNVSTYISGRLTSVTLMPDLYVGGIPTIEFESAKYVKGTYPNGKFVAASPSKDVIVSNNSTSAEYRLSPNMVGETDIDLNGLAFVSRIAEARAAGGENDVVNVASASVEAGVLTVKLGKSNTESLNLTGNKIYTVALKVPVAAKHLFTAQGETSANVYSEYTRLAETYFTPELRYVKDAYLGTLDHPVDSVTAYGYAMNAGVVKQVVYNETYDLYDLVEGCKLFSNPTTHKAMTLEQVREYGFDIKFRVAAGAYEVGSVDKTNQQKFARVSGDNGNTLTPVLPTGAGNNQAIIGKQPIICAVLVDVTNNNVIDQKYFKVQYTAEKMEDVKLTIPTHASDLVCGNQEWNITWNQMVEYVLSQVGENGISKEDFIKIYGTGTPAPTVVASAGTLDVTLEPGLDGTGASVPVIEWTLTPAEVGKIVLAGSKDFTGTITFTDPQGLHPTIIVTLTWTITAKDPNTVLGATDPLKWSNEQMLIYPVPMAIPYDGTQTAEYNTNILEGRLQPYVKSMMECGYWDVDFDGTFGGTSLTFQSGFGHWLMNLANQNTLKTISFKIANDPDGIALVESAATVKLKWQSNLNGQAVNAYTFGNSTLKIVKILTLNSLATGSFSDDSKESQAIDLTKAYSLTDAYGHLVATEATATEPYAPDYYAFYVVHTPVFDANGMYVADDAAGNTNKRTLESLNMTANIDATTNKITFQNNGAPLQADAYLIVPVTVQHKWGKLSGKIAIQIKKTL